MKKLLALLLALVICLSLMACSSKDKDNKDDKTEDTSDVQEDTGESNGVQTEPVSTEPVTDEPTEQPTVQLTAVEAFVEENKQDLLDTFTASFSGSGMTCTANISASGNGFTIDVFIDELENLDDTTKELMQETYASLDSVFEEALTEMQTTLPELEYYNINVCDKNGVVIAVIEADGVVTEPEEDPTEEIISDAGSVAEYIELYSDDIISSFEESFAATSGMTCKSDLKIVGNGFILDICINELENLDDATKQTLQDTYDSMDSTFEASLADMQTAIPGLEYYTVNVCDKNGDLLASVNVGN